MLASRKRYAKEIFQDLPSLQLKRLNLSDTMFVPDPSFLGRLRGLEELWLDRCAWLSDLSSIGLLTELRFLSLTECLSFADLTPLVGLKRLKLLSLSGCEGVRDSKLLPFLPSLERLYMGQTLLREFRPSAPLPELRLLDLSHSRELSLISLQSFPKLTKVLLSGCPALEDLTALKELPSLSHVYVVGCHRLNQESKALLEKWETSGVVRVSRN